MDHAPLAERMRPRELDEVVGQEHLVGPDGILRKALASGMLPSMILWGPPGVGKTTLARLIAERLKRPFHTLSAISSGVKDVREVIAKAGGAGLFSTSAILFIDEIHRFSKAQQDSLLGAVEQGTITLIGATTENPSFEVIGALLSRCQVYTLEPLTEDLLLALLERAMQEDAQLKGRTIHLQETAALMRASGGDARRLLNTFELCIKAAGPGEVTITDDLVKEVVQGPAARYDKQGEQHYDIVSAFIKSLRGSDPHAAVYWLARMVEGGEDPLFIARRMVILASEDIGNANPNALLMATTSMQAAQLIGWPESRIILSQCAIYLATSPKSNSSYLAIGKAQQLVHETGDLPVPLHLRNAPTKLMKDIGYGKGYGYSHEGQGNFLEQEFLPEALSGTAIYEPGNNPREKEHAALLRRLWGERYSQD
ncbi:MAG: replication-associated recombination protein A [Flavobacteriales bacterium]|nr:replication-associated recombination protein A [Flavobacteriales bacterium]HPF67661.1 replication-associated recombination protein A [Flavobacteriales bacterium]HPQ58715.1 replication-associated recombination protein A [Flavobacteriales bacterium]HRW89797.1 replication-associated recombination protein A [Flavobacteriales bacterium]